MVITQQRNLVSRTWGSSVGKKSLMAVTGVIFLLFVIAHMLGNLKIFFGITAFDAYSEHLRTLGEDIFGYAGVLWIIRVVLLGSVLLHMAAAFTLWFKAKRARPIGYAHRPSWQGSYAARTMRWGGTILFLFIVWHILDLTAGVVNPDFEEGAVYHNVTQDFQHWWSNLIYIAAMVALGLHINHGFWSASQTLGINNARRDRAIKATGTTLALVISLGFIAVPVAVMTGLTR